MTPELLFTVTLTVANAGVAAFAIFETVKLRTLTRLTAKRETDLLCVLQAFDQAAYNRVMHRMPTDERSEWLKKTGFTK